jgi:Kef-type K+ transport system membrane component KefB
MHEISTKLFPITDPVLIFSLVLFIILLAPVILNRFRIPSVVGLILAGVAIGPHGFNILLRDNGIILFGTVGILYIMFLAGLEIDLNEFRKNRNKSITFGILTFSIPLVLGTLASYYILHLSLVSSILLASMFSSHTLLAYPIASRLGILRMRPVTITVGGTIITDTAALLILAIITELQSGHLDLMFWLRLLLLLSVYTAFIIIGYPWLARWFFKQFESEGTSQYIFVLALVFLAAFLSELIGIEPIIGAFLAGLTLNRLIPHTSTLMNRIEFVGNALFIPFFLINVGMLVDLKVFFTGNVALIVAGVMVAVALLSKWLAAFATQLIFRMLPVERDVIFGLSASHAAATLAIVLVGYELGLLNDYVLNGTIVIILVSSLTASFVVERSGRRLALLEKPENPEAEAAQHDRILVPITRPDDYEPLMDLALVLRQPHSTEPLYPLSVVADNESFDQNVALSNRLKDQVRRYASAGNHPVQIITRVDHNLCSGILGAIKDLMISEVLIGWDEKGGVQDLLFGSLSNNLVEKTEKAVFLARLVQPINTLHKIAVVAPANAEFEKGFGQWIDSISTAARQLGVAVTFFSSRATLDKIAAALRTRRVTSPARYHEFDNWDDFLVLAREVQKDDLLVVVSARRGSISYQQVMDSIPKKLNKHFPNSNIILYPEQNPVLTKEGSLQSESIDISPIQENIERLSKLGKEIKSIFSKKEDSPG